MGLLGVVAHRRIGKHGSVVVCDLTRGAVLWATHNRRRDIQIDALEDAPHVRGQADQCVVSRIDGDRLGQGGEHSAVEAIET